MSKRVCWVAPALLVFAACASADDDTMDWLLKQATTAPATQPSQPTSKPANPFAEKPRNPEARMGVLLLSNGERIRATLSTTREKPLRVWNEQEKQYHDVPFFLIKSMEVRILWERDEKEWHFRESGSDVKEYTGKTYPARELTYDVTLINDQKVSGGVVAPIYATGGEQTLTFVLYKRQKGDVGKTLKDLVYIKRIELE